MFEGLVQVLLRKLQPEKANFDGDLLGPGVQVVPGDHVLLGQEGLPGSPAIADTLFVQNLCHPACTGLEGHLKMNVQAIYRHQKHILPGQLPLGVGWTEPSAGPGAVALSALVPS